mgnify:CR=1 FL=1
MTAKHIIKFIFIILLFSCDNILQDEYDEPQNDLNIYDIWKQNTPLLEDDNGFYHFPYNPTGTSSSDYGTVKYNTALSTTLVSWDSPNEFCIFFQIEHVGSSTCRRDSIFCKNPIKKAPQPQAGSKIFIFDNSLWKFFSLEFFCVLLSSLILINFSFK